MVSIKVLGEVLVITSAIKAEDIKLLQKTNPRKLVLVENDEGKKSDVYAVSFKEDDSSFGMYGMVFGKANSDGYAQCTVHIAGTVDVNKFITDNLTTGISHLEQLEFQVNENAEYIRANNAAVLSRVELLD